MNDPAESLALKFISRLLTCLLLSIASFAALVFWISFGKKLIEETGVQVCTVICLSVYFVSVAISYLWIKLKKYAKNTNETKKEMFKFACISGMVGPLNILFLFCAIADAEKIRFSKIITKESERQRIKEKKYRYFQKKN